MTSKKQLYENRHTLPVVGQENLKQVLFFSVLDRSFFHVTLHPEPFQLQPDFHLISVFPQVITE